MAKKTDPPPDDPEQSARFVETAKELDADKAKAKFGRVFKKILPKPKASNSTPHKADD